MSWQPRTLRGFLEQTPPGAQALVTPSGRFTYGELLAKAKSAAGAMQALGLKPGDHVGILMGNDEKWLALFYGAALIGAVTVPVNTRFKRGEIEFCLRQADVQALFYVRSFLKIDFEEMLSGIKPAIAI